MGFADGDTEWVWQTLEDARIPILTTFMRNESLALELCAFAVAGNAAQSLAAPTPESVKTSLARGFEVAGDHRPRSAWAQPNSDAEPAFKDVYMRMNHPLRYRFAAQPDRTFWVVFGFCEGALTEEGQRVLDLKIEGRTIETVDTVKKVGKNSPFVVCTEATEANRDGFIDVEVAAAPSAKEINPILNALWVFEKKPDEASVIAGAVTRDAYAYLPCGDALSMPSRPPRVGLMRVTVNNRGKVVADSKARITIRSASTIAFDELTGTVFLGQARHDDRTQWCRHPFRPLNFPTNDI
ncbi:MAG: hypothetical protein K1Y02_14995 [Candidatus Hydrogenedentes bacterium]|nr:hypothetical protein [Candidatus Hydrogenedentota bacterium]